MRDTPIRCTLVGCMLVRYVLIFENGFVVLDAEPGLAVMSGSAAAEWAKTPVRATAAHLGPPTAREHKFTATYYSVKLLSTRHYASSEFSHRVSGARRSRNS
jgi:hypothetical protein